ncbi:MAG: aspartyl/asparaginyl beta-hydroxylase domain-containing protein [Rhodospirillales bacterium]|nr:aspartyl/asparaginyl beta-hydroxylase domain-containing protein [Rhodospirillales bacterium]
MSPLSGHPAIDTSATLDAPASRTAPPAAAVRRSEKERRDAREKRRLVERIARWAKRLNATHSKVADLSVFDNRDFPWVADIERDWRLIRTELDRVLQRQADLPAFHEVVAEFKTITRDNHWKTFFLLGYGAPLWRNIEQCPDTWRILQRIPGLKTAMFSILEPGKHLPPHKGPYNGVLRLHLALIVPEPNDALTLRVGDRVCHWQEGKVLIFDDYFEHEVWNGSTGTRVVLFVDFLKPLRFPANIVNRLLLRLAPFTPFVREAQERHRAWEKRYYAK